MKKILLLGSAGYIKDWWAANGMKYVNDGHAVCAINNAWAVCPDNVSIWIRAEDFFCTPENVIPTHLHRNKWYEVVKTKDVPISYAGGRTGGTMILNAICHSVFCVAEKRKEKG